MVVYVVPGITVVLVAVTDPVIKSVGIVTTVPLKVNPGIATLMVMGSGASKRLITVTVITLQYSLISPYIGAGTVMVIVTGPSFVTIDTVTNSNPVVVLVVPPSTLVIVVS